MIQLRKYQEDAVNSIFSYFFNGATGNPLLCLPTGSGKSVIIAEFLHRILTQWPNQKIIVATHVKELIVQNHSKLIQIWPYAPAGIHSASLGQRDIALPIIFGGIASMIKKTDMFGIVDLLIIDEAHLLSPKDGTMYQSFIARLKEINPKLKVIGLTATPFRLGQGMLTDGGLFTDICYDITAYQEFNKLIADGYLSPLISKRTATKVDVSDVGMNNGDFALGELERAVDKTEITFAAMRELVQYGHDRKSWLVFASGIDHAEHCADMLKSFGVTAEAIHSKITKEQRDQRIEDFKNGQIRCLTNNNVLTTGFDHPQIDIMAMLRPTMSPGLWVQMAGRGMRPAPAKENCMLLDFAGNTERLGPINDPVIPKKKGKGNGEIPVKICEACGTYNHISARYCVGCGNEFTFETKIVPTAATQEVLRSDLPVTEWFDVSRVTYREHNKIGSPPSIKVTYSCGLQKFTEYVNLEHPNYASKHAREWWRQRMTGEPPAKTKDALLFADGLRTPKKIKVWVNAKYPRIMATEF